MKEEIKNGDEGQKDFCFSKTVKAGKRIYYIDAKKNRKDEMFVSITESKKSTTEDGQICYEKHKLFLYREDFEPFRNALNEIFEFIKKEQGCADSRTTQPKDEKEFKLDIEF